MAETLTIHVRLPKAAVEKLDALAESTKRSRSWLAAEAITDWVDTNAWQVEAMRKAVEQADAGGPWIEHEDMMRYLDALDRGEKPEPPPTFFKRNPA